MGDEHGPCRLAIAALKPLIADLKKKEAAVLAVPK
jgi:hypothetical protein